MSVSTIEFGRKNQEGSLAVRLFADDFGEYLQNHYRLQEIQFSDSSQATIDVIQRYIRKKILVRVNDQQIEWFWQGLEFDEDENVVEVRFSSDLDSQIINSIEVQNTILFEQFSSQTNIVKLKIGSCFHHLWKFDSEESSGEKGGINCSL